MFHPPGVRLRRVEGRIPLLKKAPSFEKGARALLRLNGVAGATVHLMDQSPFASFPS
jgi:hypothetical protein